MSEPSLLPFSQRFHALRGAGATRLSALPVSLNQLWDPDTCPVALLPYLAWALSVDRWDRDWTEETKRQVIRDAWAIHRHKGTISAIRRVVEPFGYVINVTEWWKPAIREGLSGWTSVYWIPVSPLRPIPSWSASSMMPAR